MALFHDLSRWISGDAKEEACADYLKRVAPFECFKEVHKTLAETLALAAENASLLMIPVLLLLRSCRR